MLSERGGQEDVDVLEVEAAAGLAGATPVGRSPMIPTPVEAGREPDCQRRDGRDLQGADRQLHVFAGRLEVGAVEPAIAAHLEGHAGRIEVRPRVVARGAGDAVPARKGRDG